MSNLVQSFLSFRGSIPSQGLPRSCFVDRTPDTGPNITSTPLSFLVEIYSIVTLGFFSTNVPGWDTALLQSIGQSIVMIAPLGFHICVFCVTPLLFVGMASPQYKYIFIFGEVSHQLPLWICSCDHIFCITLPFLLGWRFDGIDIYL